MPRPVAAEIARGESLPSNRITVARRTTACTTADSTNPRISAQRISHVIAPAIASACQNQPTTPSCPPDPVPATECGSRLAVSQVGVVAHGPR